MFWVALHEKLLWQMGLVGQELSVNAAPGSCIRTAPLVTARRTGLCPTEHPPGRQNQLLCTDCIHPIKARERHHARESLQE